MKLPSVRRPTDGVGALRVLTIEISQKAMHGLLEVANAKEIPLAKAASEIVESLAADGDWVRDQVQGAELDRREPSPWA